MTTAEHNMTCIAYELQATFQLEILGVKKNPQGAVTTQLGVITVRFIQFVMLDVNKRQLAASQMQ